MNWRGAAQSSAPAPGVREARRPEYAGSGDRYAHRAGTCPISSAYLYDYNGQRALKRGPSGESWYIDQYYQIQNGHQVEKHIFVGSTRMVTRLEDRDWYDRDYEDHNVFYYHPDHLGSTTFVTTQSGHEWEHMEYIPYGNQWIDEGTDKSVIAYRFTSKEFDKDTGLYYYGVRYLDPVAARWMTADPGYSNYLPIVPSSPSIVQHNRNLPGEGGVYNLSSLDPYGYAADNPVKISDPDGHFLEIVVGAIIGFGVSVATETASHLAEAHGNIGQALLKSFSDPVSLANIATGTLLGAATSGLSAFAGKAITTGVGFAVESDASVVGKSAAKIAVDATLGATGSATSYAAGQAYAGKRVNAGEALNAAVTGAVVGGAGSILGEGVSGLSRMSVEEPSGRYGDLYDVNGNLIVNGSSGYSPPSAAGAAAGSAANNSANLVGGGYSATTNAQNNKYTQ